MRLALLVGLSAFVLASACTTFGPKPEISLIDAAAAKKETVNNIVIPAVTGIDAAGNTGKALTGAYVKAYGKRARPVSAIKPVLSGVGAPDGLADMLAAGYQAEFIKAAETVVVNKGKRPNSLQLATGGMDLKVPTSAEGIQKLAATLKTEAGAITQVATALTSGNSQQLQQAISAAKSVMPLVQQLNGWVFEKLTASHVLLTHCVGTETEYNAGKEVTFVASLVDLKSGKMRYWATVKVKKGTVPVPFMAAITGAANNLLDAANEKDPLPEMKAH